MNILIPRIVTYCSAAVSHRFRAAIIRLLFGGPAAIFIIFFYRISPSALFINKRCIIYNSNVEFSTPLLSININADFIPSTVDAVFRGAEVEDARSIIVDPGGAVEELFKETTAPYCR